MNLIKKQGIFNSIALNLGTALAFVNLAVVFQRSLTLEEIGFYNILISVVILYTQFATLGISNVITRFLPIFRTADKKHHGFASYVFIICTVTFTLFSVFFFILKDEVIAWKATDDAASLMDTYYPYFFPIAVCATLFLIQESFARTVFKTILPSFLREVVLRLFSTFGAILMLFGYLGYKGFIDLYLMGNILILLIVTGYTYRIKTYRFGAIEAPVKKEYTHMLRFGFYSMLGGSSFALLQHLDILILKVFTGEAMVGIYATFFSMAQIIALPSRALNITSYQIIANAWKENDLTKIDKIYKKTTVIQCLAGCLLLVGLIVNRDSILTLLKKPEYPAYFDLLIIVGLAFLVDAAGGINQAIIGFSKHYRLVMLFMLAAAVLCAILNLLLIPRLGLEGAAYSYLLTMLFNNFSFWLYLKVRYHMQPFNGKILLIILTAAISLILGMVIPSMPHFLIDICVRSGIVTLMFGILTYLFRISPDVNEMIDQYILRKTT
ncbi:oligosaccharide flippase family protein [Olivibacter sp. SDN3]|uniref:oligosaccharide flippase family protein n=1 Tax=Olivibacter sp. SDN3 TaxID=2764720 RepID=UPI0016512D1A|nr:oligosaccharide flippase family protein [Olivibacter sp. SDN3]QNL51417.1 oligosaccharide flippase family protein [Olivibacter sp. SDN3]